MSSPPPFPFPYIIPAPPVAGAQSSLVCSHPVPQGDYVGEVLDGIMISLKRGYIPQGPKGITTNVLGGNKNKKVMGLCERILKRRQVATYLYQSFPMADPAQKAIAEKFSTFELYDLHLPSVTHTNMDLTWMSSRTPDTVCLTNILKKIWEGELDFDIKSGLESYPNGTPEEWIKSVDKFRNEIERLKSEYDLARKATAQEANATAENGQKPGTTNKGASDVSAETPVDPETQKLKHKAFLRRAETAMLKATDGSAAECERMIEDSAAGKATGQWSKKHVAIVGDMAQLPEQANRPWAKPPHFTREIAGGRLDAATRIFQKDGNEHFILIHFDGAREANRGPIRKHFDGIPDPGVCKGPNSINY